MEKTNITKINDRFRLICSYKKYLAWAVACGCHLEQNPNNPTWIRVARNDNNSTVLTMLIKGRSNPNSKSSKVEPVAIAKLRSDMYFIAKEIERFTGKKFIDPNAVIDPQFSEDALLAEEATFGKAMGEELEYKAKQAYTTVELDNLVNDAFDRKYHPGVFSANEIKSEPHKTSVRHRK